MDHYPQVWYLHFGVFVVFFPMVQSFKQDFGSAPSMSALRMVLPPWVFWVCMAISAYAILNFILFFVSMQQGSPAIWDGKYVLQSHGHFVRELSGAEYAQDRANELRGFSGHWLVFYSVSFAYFMFAKADTSRRFLR
ncbi:hypothetical protein [Chromobacterium alticapitis]|nr:hypothetical protein [Chromobacterium alticapitis]